MKTAIRFFLPILLTFFSSSLLNAAPFPAIIGKWYGLKYGGPVTIEFRNDQTMSIQTDAFSSLSFSCKYKIDSTVSPAAIDLIDIPGGMTCSAIFKLSGKNEMELFGFFGAPGYTQRPATIDSASKRFDAFYLKLSRETKIIQPKALASPPKAAQLAFERNKRLGRGINLNGLLDNNSGDLHLYPIADQPIKPEYIKMIAEAGFNSVRLPVTWSVHCSKTAPYIVDPSFFARVDSIVHLCLQNGLAVSIDIHYYPYINMSGNDSTISFDDNIKRFYSLWEQIAEHYKNYPPEVYFDVLNEPNLEMSVPFYNELIRKSIKLIRKTNPTRTILVGTPELGQSWTIGLLDLPYDDWNLIVQIHYYLPHLFTHQGLAYANAESSKGMKWLGTPEEKKPIISDFDYCAKWSKDHGRPINLGEFGANEKADMESRARYISFIGQLAEEKGFSFHVWGFREIFCVFDEDSGKWQQPIVDALIPKK
jgi:endoglucanase